jgi:hypothetical protein
MRKEFLGFLDELEEQFKELNIPDEFDNFNKFYKKAQDYLNKVEKNLITRFDIEDELGTIKFDFSSKFKRKKTVKPDDYNNINISYPGIKINYEYKESL